MMRAFSTTKNRHGYSRLEDEQPFISDAVKLKRVYSVPASKDLQHPQYQQQKYLGGSLKDPKQYKFGFSTKQSSKAAVAPLPNASQAKLARKASKIHPLFGLFDPKSSKKKTITKAEFGRYLEYVKEGGLWNMNKQTPASSS
uniref:Uncharacterized protein n=1 Tax=Kalanchoe fedtschenkoi TaxID=63787 RepID=A0A7N0UD71_KALFE